MSAEMVRYSDTSIKRSTFAMLRQRATMTFDVEDPGVSENLTISENLRVQTCEVCEEELWQQVLQQLPSRFS